MRSLTPLPNSNCCTTHCPISSFGDRHLIHQILISLIIWELIVSQEFFYNKSNWTFKCTYRAAAGPSCHFPPLKIQRLMLNWNCDVSTEYYPHLVTNYAGLHLLWVSLPQFQLLSLFFTQIAKGMNSSQHHHHISRCHTWKFISLFLEKLLPSLN